MDAWLAALAASDIATSLRVSRWSYAAVNTAHVLGIAMLVGAIVPLDLRLLGFWRHVSREDLIRVLVPIAAAGLALAICAGALLFSVRAPEYAGIVFFRVKLVLVAIGVSTALTIHLLYGFTLTGASRLQHRISAVVSMTCWLGALGCGRLIAFAAE
ncbi:MAG: hypothetical protein ABI024_17625 [Vicinamibacterales bacterium]